MDQAIWVDEFGQIQGSLSAQDFWLKTSYQKLGLARRLLCPACLEPAFFCPPSEKRKAYFGARPHVSNCSNMTTMATQRGESYQVIDDFHFTDLPIVIDLSNTECFGSTNFFGVPQGNPAALSGDPLSVVGTAFATRVTRRLGPLLRDLIFYNFQNSARLITLQGCAARCVSDFFVKFSEFSRCRLGEVYGFWGEIYGVERRDPAGVFINTGRWNSLNIALNMDEELIFYDRHGLSVATHRELQGQHILIIGVLAQYPSGSYYVQAKHPHYSALNSDDYPRP